MPTVEKILGFKNQWYSLGIENKISKRLPNGKEIYVFRPEYYLASKFEAHHDRGGSDLRQSNDFEDIIYILDSCTILLNNIKKSDEKVKSYLKEECKKLIANNQLSEGIECTLPFGSDSDRVEMIEALINDISNLT